MITDKTVAEAALEQEVALLKAERDYYKRAAGPTAVRFAKEPTLDMQFPLQPTLQLAGTWTATEENAMDRIAMFGRAWSNDPKVGSYQLGYYISKMALWQARDATVVLGEMHKQVMKQLVNTYRRDGSGSLIKGKIV